MCGSTFVKSCQKCTAPTIRYCVLYCTMPYCPHTYIYAYIHACVRVYIHIYIYIYIHTYIYIYICISICIYIYIYRHFVYSCVDFDLAMRYMRLPSERSPTVIGQILSNIVNCCLNIDHNCPTHSFLQKGMATILKVLRKKTTWVIFGVTKTYKIVINSI